jgi:hypothetical protein
MPNLPKRRAGNAAEIYRELIVRVRKSVNDKVRVVYDPETFLQKGFLDGKLIFIKDLKPTGVTFDKAKEQRESKGNHL